MKLNSDYSPGNTRLHFMVTKLFLLVLTVFAGTFSASAVGFLQLRNFSHDEYRGGPQNWAFAQDSLGRVYIGNRDGMLSFDGERWNKFALSNGTTVRSLLYVPSEGRIYAAGTDEYGYFAATPDNGLLEYHSLRGTLPKGAPKFTEIWHIHRLGKKIYFQTDNHLLAFDGKQTGVIKSSGRISTSALIEGQIYVGLENGGILQLSGHTLTEVQGCELLSGKRIQAILPGVGRFLVATSVDGLFFYSDGHISALNSDINAFLRENQLFCGATDGRTYVFGTVTRGAVIKNISTGVTRYVNRESGMLNNTVLNAAFDRTGNIWLGLDNGLDYIFFNSPVSTLFGTGNDIGAGYSTLLRGDRLYMGTNQGLFSTPYPFRTGPDQLPLSKELQGQIWSMTDGKGTFFVAGDAGIYANDGGGYYRVEGLGGGYRVRQLPNDPDRALASCYDGFRLLSRDGGRWHTVAHISGEQGLHGDFVLDKKGNVWINDWLRGLFRLSLNTDKKLFSKVKLYNQGSGLPENCGNSIIEYKGDLVIASDDGFYTWSVSADRFVLHPQLNSLLHPGPKATVHSSGKESMAILDRRGLQVSTLDSSGNRSTSSTVLRGYRTHLVNGFEHVNVLAPNEVILSTQSGFWLIDPTVKKDKAEKLSPFVNTVVADMDSIVYRAQLDGKAGSLKLPFGLASLKFELGYADYEAPGEISFSTYLENYEKDWSPYSSEASREYTQLREGVYTLKIRARNNSTEEVVEAEFHFSITPPWYRSIVAKIIYVLLALVGAALLLWLANRWKLKTERKMAEEKEKELSDLRHQAEQEALRKDYEIASLKSEQLEIDIKHKSGELSTAAMNLIRKNEILTDLATKISKIQSTEKLDAGVKRQLEQLQGQIRENISHDDVWTDFNRNFDIVYQNYTQRLHEQYPQLTSADIRLCCYIKMGLTSKDIAPLLNITVKSVEMARYRLRKKLDLAPDRSLTDYLTSF